MLRGLFIAAGGVRPGWRRRASAILLALVVGLLLSAAQPDAAGAADAQSPPPTSTTTAAPPGHTAVAGTIRVGTEPVEDVTITVTDAAGAEVDAVETGDDGAWLVEVPSAGTYTISLDEDDLPDDVRVREGARSEIAINVPIGLTRQVAFPLAGDDAGTAGAAGRSTTDKLAQSIVNGIKFGLIIAMTAIGLSLVFGTTGLVNFAHGELVTFGAIVAWFINTDGPQLQLIGATVIAVVAGALLGGGLELSLWRPLRRRRTGTFQLMVISIGLSLAARQVLLIWFGSRSLRYADYTIQPVHEFGPVEVTDRDLTVMILSIVVLLGVALFLQRTRIGKATRAVADNPDLASSTGINVERVIVVVWCVGTALAALGGVFQATVTNVNYLMGFQLLLLMFAGVVLGGLGTAYGAIVGSLVVGLATEVSTVWLSSELKFVWALAILVAVLLVRPEGILGSKERVG